MSNNKKKKWKQIECLHLGDEWERKCKGMSINKYCNHKDRKQGTLKGESDHIAPGYREAEVIGKGCWIWQFPEWSSVILEREVFIG